MRDRIGVIGGGAAGLCCAILLARGGAQVTVFEALDRVGKKLAMTGNGQCNISHQGVTPESYHGQHRDFCRTALQRFGFEEARDFFASLGVPFCVEESGNAYPASYQATSVVDALRFEAGSLGVSVHLGERVTGLSGNANGWVVESPGQTTSCRAVVLATGGLAGGEKTGSRGDGFSLAASLGHAVTPLTPAIVQLKSNSPVCRSLKGVKVNATASLWIDGRSVRRESGEVLFTDYGLSGPAIFRLSREVEARKGRKTVVLDLFDEVDEASLCRQFATRRTLLSDRPAASYFTGLLQNRLGFTLLKQRGLHRNETVGEFSDQDCHALARDVKHLAFEVTGSTGMLHAQVTAGGLDTAQFDPTTMESRLLHGLYAIGEVLDIDGDCGGYNLQWAWSSAAVCAQALLDTVSFRTKSGR